MGAGLAKSLSGRTVSRVAIQKIKKGTGNFGIADAGISRALNGGP
jgi:hypothetical protein